MSRKKPKKVNKVLQHFPTDNITKPNELIYAREKLVSNKMCTTQKESEQIYETLKGNAATNKETAKISESTKEEEI